MASLMYFACQRLRCEKLLTFSRSAFNSNVNSAVLKFTRSISCATSPSRVSNLLNKPTSRFSIARPHMLYRCCTTTLPPKKKKTDSGTGPITWKNLIITVATGAVVWLGVTYVRREKELALERERRRSLGKAAIGGSFDLTDHNGKPCSSKDFLGQWVLLYFGFTHCPDVCPDELEKMALVVDTLDKDSKVPKVQPLFITVDPERDDVKAVAAYIKEFSSKLIGLTGTHEQIKEVAKSFRVYYSSGPMDSDSDYIVDHTIIMYLINPEGEFVDYYGQTRDADQIAAGVQLQMAKYDRLKSPKWF